MSFAPCGREQRAEPHCGGLDAAAGRIVSSPTASSVPAAVRCSAPSGCEEDALGTEAMGITPGQRSLQLRAGPSCGAAFTLLAAQIHFSFLIQKSPLNMRKGTGTSKRQLFKQRPKCWRKEWPRLCNPRRTPETADARGGLKKQSDARYRPARLVRTSPVSRGTRSGAKPATKLITRTSFFFFL